MAKLQLVFDGQVKKEYEIDKPQLSIGRHKNNDIVIDNRGVSNKHAVIEVNNGEFVLSDLQSTNGTKVNGHKISSLSLNNGDQVNLFKHTLIFVSTDSAQDNISIPHKDTDNDATIMLDSSQVDSMLNKHKVKPADKKTDQNMPNKPRLEVTSADEINTIYLANKSILIGKKESCDIHTGGWFFTPDIAAVIKKEMSGLYSVVPKSKIMLNDDVIIVKHALKDGDHLLVKNTLIIFMV